MRLVMSEDYVEAERSSETIGEWKEGMHRKKKANPLSSHDCDLIHSVWGPSKEVSQRFGLRKGKWTRDEERVLRENMDRFLKKHNFENHDQLFSFYRSTRFEDRKKWKEFLRSTDVYRELADGLKRSLWSVHFKFVRSFDINNYKGNFSKAEDKELAKLVTLFGKKWTKIGQLMGRSRLAVCHRHKFVECYYNSGQWEETEEKCLQEAVRKLTNTCDSEEVYSGINWPKVSSMVKTRNEKQCRDKWLKNLCWKSSYVHTDEKRWGPANDVELIEKIYKSQVTEECDIDWLSLTTDFEMARSPEWLRIKFGIIKRKYCKSIDFEVTEFEDVIDYLYNVIAIDLQNQMFVDQESPV